MFTFGCKKATTDPATVVLLNLSNASQKLASRVMPGVIQLDVNYQRQPVNDHFQDYYGVTPKPYQVGSGVIISSDGYALTNYHVVRGAQSIKVTLNDGRQVKAEVVGTDALTDIALLRLPLKDLTAIPWGDSDKAYAGSFAWSFGSPLEMSSSVSLGIISSSSTRSYSADNPFHDFLQTDASINPGSSGGPLIDATGKIVGINTAIAGDQFTGVGFAIPSKVAQDVANNLREHGKIDRAWIGVDLTAVNQSEAILAGRNNIAGSAVRGFVTSQTPAENVGIRVGDLILEIDGVKVSGPTHAIRLIAQAKIDQPLKVLIQRKSESKTIEVSPKTLPTGLR